MSKRTPKCWEDVTLKWRTRVLDELNTLASECEAELEFVSGREASELRCAARAARLAHEKLSDIRRSYD